jgi:hypothetical protein
MIPVLAGGNCPAEVQPWMVDEFSLRKGDFVAVIKPSKSQYEFFMRDLRREEPTIQGFGVDFSNAVSTVTQLLDALTKER